MENIKYLQNRLRKHVANDISLDTGWPYDEVLSILEEFKFFSRWDHYELENRPVDVDEIADFVTEYVNQ